jgi:hypothetical protein
MEFFKTYKTGGGFTTFKFSEGEYLDYSLTMLLFAIAFGIVFSVFISPILLVLRIVAREDDDSWVFSVIGIITCVYVLIDIHYCWLYSVILRAFHIVETDNLSALSLAYICGHLWVLIFKPKNFWGSAFVTAIVVFSLFLVFKAGAYGPQAPNQPVKQEILN